MAEIKCRTCESPNCHGCNIYRLEQMLAGGKLDVLMNDNHAIQIDAEVRPVVRGAWVGIDDVPHNDWECDHCGCVVGNTDDPWNYYHFCPNCGADMRCCLGENL